MTPSQIKEQNRRFKSLEEQVYYASRRAPSITTYTTDHIVSLANRSAVIEMDVAGANTVTVPSDTDVDFPATFETIIVQYGAGQTTIVAGAGVTINSDSGLLAIATQFSAATLMRRGANEWYLIGNLA